MTDLATLHWQRKTLDTASPAVQSSLDRCTEEDVPILKLLRQACPPGMHGFGCDTRWDVHDSFLPRPRRWVRQFNASRARAAMPDGVDCQRGFFDAFGAALTRMHWEQEWDAQPFRISATPPRTIGKMLHQLITANYYHLTLGPEKRPKLRSAPAPGHHYKPLPQPGFRWNVLDYGGGMQEEIDYKRLVTMPGNVLSRPLSAGRRCKGRPADGRCRPARVPPRPPHRPAWTMGRLRPLLRTPERRLSSLEARRRPKRPPQATRKSRSLREQACGRRGTVCGSASQHSPTRAPRPRRPARSAAPRALCTTCRSRANGPARLVGKCPLPCLRTAARLPPWTHPKARGAPTHPGAPPEPLGSLPWPPQLASAGSQGDGLPACTLRPGGLVQYLVATGVTAVFTQPTPQERRLC